MKDEVRRADPIAFDHTRRAITPRAHEDRIQSINVDAAALASALKREIRGEVRFDDGARAMYATDASNYRQVPIGVVVPRTLEDVVEAVATARAHGAPL